MYIGQVSVDMDISMNIHIQSVDMDGKFHIHDKGANLHITCRTTSSLTLRRRHVANLIAAVAFCREREVSDVKLGAHILRNLFQ